MSGIYNHRRFQIRQSYIQEVTKTHIPLVQEEHARMTSEFLRKAQDLGYGDMRNYFWYYTIDFGNGLITPGVYDYRHTLDAFDLPESMAGMNVLDVGAATGFFSLNLKKAEGVWFQRKFLLCWT